MASMSVSFWKHLSLKGASATKLICLGIGVSKVFPRTHRPGRSWTGRTAGMLSTYIYIYIYTHIYSRRTKVWSLGLERKKTNLIPLVIYLKRPENILHPLPMGKEIYSTEPRNCIHEAKYILHEMGNLIRHTSYAQVLISQPLSSASAMCYHSFCVFAQET